MADVGQQLPSLRVHALQINGAFSHPLLQHGVSLPQFFLAFFQLAGHLIEVRGEIAELVPTG